MKKLINRFRKLSLFIAVLFVNFPVLADLPTPPSSDMPTGSSDWIDVGGGLMTKAIKVACVGVGAAILIGAAYGTMKAYHTAHEKQEIGHFFKMLIVSLIAAALGLGLVYAGFNIVSSS